MLYMIYSTDAEGSLQQRLATRPAHLARLQELQQQQRLFAAGPLPAIDSEEPGEAGFSGSLVIAEFANLEEAKQWASEDPYIDAVVYTSSIVKPYKRVLP